MVVSSAHLSVSPCNRCPSAKPVPYNLSCYFQVFVSVLVKTQAKLLQWRPQKTLWLKCGQHLSESSQGLRVQAGGQRFSIPSFGDLKSFRVAAGWSGTVLPCLCGPKIVTHLCSIHRGLGGGGLVPCIV